jgi:hypothetical protein
MKRKAPILLLLICIACVALVGMHYSDSDASPIPSGQTERRAEPVVWMKLVYGRAVGIVGINMRNGIRMTHFHYWWGVQSFHVDYRVFVAVLAAIPIGLAGVVWLFWPNAKVTTKA